MTELTGDVLERRRITVKAGKLERRKTREQDNDTAVCVCSMCGRISRA